MSFAFLQCQKARGEKAEPRHFLRLNEICKITATPHLLNKKLFPLITSRIACVHNLIKFC